MSPSGSDNDPQPEQHLVISRRKDWRPWSIERVAIESRSATQRSLPDVDLWLAKPSTQSRDWYVERSPGDVPCSETLAATRILDLDGFGPSAIAPRFPNLRILRMRGMAAKDMYNFRAPTSVLFPLPATQGMKWTASAAHPLDVTTCVIAMHPDCGIGIFGKRYNMWTLRRVVVILPRNLRSSRRRTCAQRVLAWLAPEPGLRDLEYRLEVTFVGVQDMIPDLETTVAAVDDDVKSTERNRRILASLRSVADLGDQQGYSWDEIQRLSLDCLEFVSHDAYRALVGERDYVLHTVF